MKVHLHEKESDINIEEYINEVKLKINNTSSRE